MVLVCGCAYDVSFSQLSCELLDNMKDEILKVPGITRVMYDLTAKPPGTTEWE